MTNDARTTETVVVDRAWAKDPRAWALAQLLIECRDALPALTTVQCRLHNISPSLADRIDTALEPWAVAPGEDGI
jgi:hypothetical protein